MAIGGFFGGVFMGIDATFIFWIVAFLILLGVTNYVLTRVFRRQKVIGTIIAILVSIAIVYFTSKKYPGLINNMFYGMGMDPNTILTFLPWIGLGIAIIIIAIWGFGMLFMICGAALTASGLVGLAEQKSAAIMIGIVVFIIGLGLWSKKRKKKKFKKLGYRERRDIKNKRSAKRQRRWDRFHGMRRGAGRGIRGGFKRSFKTDPYRRQRNIAQRQSDQQSQYKYLRQKQKRADRETIHDQENADKKAQAKAKYGQAREMRRQRRAERRNRRLAERQIRQQERIGERGRKKDPNFGKVESQKEHKEKVQKRAENISRIRQKRLAKERAGRAKIMPSMLTQKSTQKLLPGRKEQKLLPATTQTAIEQGNKRAWKKRKIREQEKMMRKQEAAKEMTSMDRKFRSERKSQKRRKQEEMIMKQDATKEHERIRKEQKKVNKAREVKRETIKEGRDVHNVLSAITNTGDLSSLIKLKKSPGFRKAYSESSKVKAAYKNKEQWVRRATARAKNEKDLI